MSVVGEHPELFESRKADHIRLALDPMTQTTGGSGLEQIRLIHEAIPDLDFSEVSLRVPWIAEHPETCAVPMFISSMTAGHAGSLNLNRVMALVAERRGWAMGVGSQRRQLSDPHADREWKEIRKQCPRVRFFGNIGLAQLISIGLDDVRRLADSLEASAMIVHTNPLQECLQPEGTTQFRGGFAALERLVRSFEIARIPVVLKETGCGFSKATLKRLNGIGLSAVDVAGFGGTHWGRIEGGRSKPESLLREASETFANWGISTVDSLLAAVDLKPDYEVWASGGVRSGLDAAKLLAMGAKMVGIAQPVIEAALEGEPSLDRRLERFEFEMKTAMFCTGTRTVAELREKRTWESKKI